VDSLDLAVNGRPDSVSIAGCTGRLWALWGSHLEARVGETGAGEGRMVASRGTVATMSKRACGKAGKRGKTGRRCSLPQRRAPRVLARWWKAVCVGQLRCGGGELAWLGFVR
jgi:hypothetical protein